MTFAPMNRPGVIEEILAMPALPGMTAPAEPFVWGQGGAQLTPEQLAGEREIAQALAQSDYSPVQNWAQGLGRVVDNFQGSQDLKRLDRQQLESNAQTQAQIAAALGPDNADLAAILAGGNKNAVGMVDNIYKSRNPTKPAPTEWERTLQASGVMPGTEAWTKAMATKVANTLDPWTSLVSGGESIMGRQSQVQQALGGGGPVSSGGAAGEQPFPDGAMSFNGARSMMQGASPEQFVRWQQQTGAPVNVTSPDELNALPAGAIYVGPDGVKRQK